MPKGAWSSEFYIIMYYQNYWKNSKTLLDSLAQIGIKARDWN